LAEGIFILVNLFEAVETSGRFYDGITLLHIDYCLKHLPMEANQCGIAELCGGFPQLGYDGSSVSVLFNIKFTKRYERFRIC
jgi:hypothetical protein